MTAVCSKPHKGYFMGKGKPLVFARPPGHSGAWMPVPCNECLSCQVKRASEMAARIYLETLAFEGRSEPGLSWFVTATYSPEHLPADGELVEAEAQRFIDTVRKSLRRKYGREWRLRYVYCAERGGTTGRAHFHFIFWGLPLEDRKPHKRSGEHELYSSAWLDRLWGKGFCLSGPVTPGACEYVAAYTVQSSMGRVAAPTVLDPATGELRELRRPYARYSTHPGIGAEFFDKYGDQIRPGNDYVVINGVKRGVPRYFLERMKASRPEDADALLERRVDAACDPATRWNRTPERLRVREVCLAGKLGIGELSGRKSRKVTV